MKDVIGIVTEDKKEMDRRGGKEDNCDLDFNGRRAGRKTWPQGE